MTTGISSSAAQAQLRHNALEQVDALKDLNTWEASMRNREGKECDLSCKSTFYEPALPPPHRDGAKNSVVLGLDEVSKSSRIRVQAPLNPIVVKAYPTNSETITKDYANIDEIRLRGNSFYADGKYKDAIACYTRCLVFNKYSCALCFSNRGNIYFCLI